LARSQDACAVVVVVVGGAQVAAALLYCAVDLCVVQASGFCYINDIVLAILELLKYHRYGRQVVRM
jgi:hypothetical protein